MTSDGTTATGGLTGITADTPEQEAKAGAEQIDSILTTRDEVLDADGTPVRGAAPGGTPGGTGQVSGAAAAKEADTSAERGLVTRAGVTGTSEG